MKWMLMIHSCFGNMKLVIYIIGPVLIYTGTYMSTY